MFLFLSTGVITVFLMNMNVIAFKIDLSVFKFLEKLKLWKLPKISILTGSETFAEKDRIYFV